MDLNENLFRVKQMMGLINEQQKQSLPYIVSGKHTVPSSDSNPCDAFHGFQLSRNPSARMNVQVRDALNLFKDQPVWVSDVELTNWDVQTMTVEWRVTIDKSNDGKFWNGFTSRGAGCDNDIFNRWNSEEKGNGPLSIETKITTDVKDDKGNIITPKTCKKVEAIELIKSLQVLTQTPESEKSAGKFRFIQGFYRYRCGQSNTNQQTNTTTVPNTASSLTTSTSNNQQSTTNSAAPTSSKATNSSTQTSSQSVSSAASTNGMNTVDDVKKFQLFLDKNYPGWHDKYGTLGTNTARGHGKFGPRTKKWFDWVGEKFLMDELGTEVKPTETSNEPSNETPKQTSQSPSKVPPTTTFKANPTQGFQKFVQGQVGTPSQKQTSASVESGPKSKGMINPDMEF